jgi:hypothetical protein
MKNLLKIIEMKFIEYLTYSAFKSENNHQTLLVYDFEAR